MSLHRNSKIIATLGPASGSEAQIIALAEAGVNVFRLNFSHGSHAEHRQRFDAVRAAEQALGRPLAVLQDLQGPKLRIGIFQGGPQTLLTGARFDLDLDDLPGDGNRVMLPHPEIFECLSVGDRLLIDDGKLCLRVTACDARHAQTEVEVGGVISDRKGVNLPQTRLRRSVLTQKDRDDLAFGLALGIDWVALSFVQHADDVRELQRLVRGAAGIVAKLEKPLAIEHLQDIVAVADAVMVARGDLGVELPAQEVPILQRRIIRACRQAGKPVIVATQMLESMIQSPVPTRAEASDVATAVYEGADAVMLSAESASGRYPLESVQMMARIIERVEADPALSRIQSLNPHDSQVSPDPAQSLARAVSAAVSSLAGGINLGAILTYTTAGTSALNIAQERPAAPIVGLTPLAATARRLALVWGVRPCLSPDAQNVEEMVSMALSVAQDMAYTASGSPVAIIAGMPFGTPGSTNLLRLAWPKDTVRSDAV